MKVLDFILRYSLPIMAALLICIFYLGLPSLKSCTLQTDKDSKRLGKKDLLLMLIISAVYGAVAFTGLGDMKAPESFKNMENESVVLELEESGAAKLMLYTGVGIGGYEIAYAPPGEDFRPLSELSQSHGDDLKWLSVELGERLDRGRIKISGWGNVWLGEFCAVDEKGDAIAVKGDSSLTDEQSLCPEKQTYMNSSYFDEIYHARTAWEHLNGVYPYEITHPPLGKIIISLGISLFGMTPFGWRFSGTLFGVLMLPLMYILLKKLFGGRIVPTAGTIVFAADFMHFTQTRIATIDTYAVFFILLMYLFMYLFLTEEKLVWLGLCGLAFGLGAASKWTCFYAGAGLALLWTWYWLRHSSLGIKAFMKNVGFCCLFFLLIPGFIYYLAYIPYGKALGIGPFSMDYLRMVLDNQEYMFSYHSGVTAQHPYSSRWYQWVLDIRPILYYLEYMPNGYRSSFGAFVNPMLCWGGLLALFVLSYLAFFRKDRKAGFIILGYLAQLLPWVLVSRITFEYHYFPSSVFLVLAMGYIFHIFVKNCRRGKVYVWGFTGLCVGLFCLFYPAISGLPVPNELATELMGWLPSWPF